LRRANNARKKIAFITVRFAFSRNRERLARSPGAQQIDILSY
jgi:hypothetical protein